MRRQKANRRRTARRSRSRQTRRTQDIGAAIIALAGLAAVLGIVVQSSNFLLTPEGLEANDNLAGYATAQDINIAISAYSESTGTYFSEQAAQCLQERCAGEANALNCVSNYAEFCSIS